MVRIAEDGVDEPVGLVGAETRSTYSLARIARSWSGASRSCLRWKASW